MDLGLTGKVALVTGSSRGIGRGIALALGDAGCNVVVTGRDRAALDETAASIKAKGGRAVGLALDLTDAGAAATLVESAHREFGGLDILVNNAGATKRGDFLALGDADWQGGFALKLFAHVRLARTAWPSLKERRGSLVTIAGTGGRKPEANFAIGSSVNAACAAFTKALAHLGKTDGVQVNCIHPSIVDTDRQRTRIRAEMQRTGEAEAAIRARMAENMGTMRFGTPKDVADLVCFIVSSNATWLHGATIDLDGGEIPVL
jgi:3-oxoacyl-[acyl-carrier protein] reductase